MEHDSFGPGGGWGKSHREGRDGTCRQWRRWLRCDHEFSAVGTVNGHTVDRKRSAPIVRKGKGLVCSHAYHVGGKIYGAAATVQADACRGGKVKNDKRPHVI